MMGVILVRMGGELEETIEDYSNCIDNPPTPVVAAYTRMNARRSDASGEFDSPASPSLKQSVSRALCRATETSPPLLQSVHNAMVRAESVAKADKTKNSSNKGRERTSIAGTIVKMMERIESSSDSNMAALMNMMMMRQLEEINQSMARHHKEGRHERKKEKKRRQKRREKRKAKQRSMENLDDHGGKVGVGLSSESSSSSDSSSSDDDSSQDSGYGKGEWRGRFNAGGEQNGLKCLRKEFY